MLYNNFKIRSLLPAEIDNFTRANIKSGFIASAPNDIALFKKAISLAEHIGIVEAEKEIKGGIMLFRRWHNAIWATNISVDPAMQSQGASAALYKYALHYCANRVQWAFCNPIASITSLHQRWGILPINAWESVVLVSVYNYFFESNTLDIALPFRTAFENNTLKAENKDMIIKIILDKQLLKVAYKHIPKKSKAITLHDTYKLRLNTAPSYVKLSQDWVFDPQNGIIINKKRDIIVYAPTASARNFIGLTIPVDDVKTPECWNYANNALQVIYTTLEKAIKVELLATFDVHGITLAISAQANSIPRLTIEHDARSTMSLTDNKQTVIDTASYNNRLHTIYNGITNKFVVHLKDIATVHKRYLRSFIPRSYRPDIRGTNPVGLFPTLPLAAALLDYTQRQLLINTPNAILELSDEGNKMLNQLKTDLYAERS